MDESLEKELQCVHIRVAFESIYKRRVDNLHQDMNNIDEILRRSPELYSELTHRENKVIKLYKMSPILGRLNIYRYMKQNKL